MLLLLDNGASAVSLMRTAVRLRKLKVVKKLLKRKVSANETSSDLPPVFVAVTANLLDYVKILYENGADINALYKGVYYLNMSHYWFMQVRREELKFSDT